MKTNGANRKLKREEEEKTTTHSIEIHLEFLALSVYAVVCTGASAVATSLTGPTVKTKEIYEITNSIRVHGTLLSLFFSVAFKESAFLLYLDGSGFTKHANRISTRKTF